MNNYTDYNDNCATKLEIHYIKNCREFNSKQKTLEDSKEIQLTPYSLYPMIRYETAI